MKKLEPPRVQVRNHAVGEQDQPMHSEVLPKLPFRMIVAGPSGCGKTEMIVSMILDMFRTKKGKSTFKRVFVFSPSVHVDMCWKPIKDFVKEELGVDTEKEPCFFDKFDPQALQDILSTQKRIAQFQKEQKHKKIFGVLLVIDDFADDVSVVKNNPVLWETYVRGRHSFVSTVVATQKYRALANIIRVNATDLCVFRLRSDMELKAILEENGAVVGGQKVLEQMYREATAEPYSFLYLRLSAKDPHEFAWLRFERPLMDSYDEASSASALPAMGGF